MTNSISNNGSWPYHENSRGEMVPCTSNPCSLHGGSDIMASSPEEAYEKKYSGVKSGLVKLGERIANIGDTAWFRTGVKAGMAAGLAGLVSVVGIGSINAWGPATHDQPATVISQESKRHITTYKLGKHWHTAMVYDTVVRNPTNGKNVTIMTAEKLNKNDNDSVRIQSGIYGSTRYAIKDGSFLKVKSDNNDKDASDKDAKATRNKFLDGGVVVGTATIATAVADMLKQQKELEEERKSRW